MTASDQNGKYRIVAEINMIPFIDIALVLLIIFMVMTPFLIRAQIKVNLPSAGKADAAPENAEAVKVQVAKAGGFWVNALEVPRDEVAAAVRRQLQHPESQPLIIEADRDVSFQHVVVVLDAGKQAGAAKVSVSVRQESAAPDGSR